ncbi:helix-turn-helix domain-containing protein [Micromonospora globbae]|uniref:helix-turn-helix domain-containing protein n=1 Tax=Micromonospora globbae TaxID=1894969 RepID=UPI003428B06B
MTAPTRTRPPVDSADLEILAMVADGQTTRQIGRRLGRTTNGVQSHLSRLYRRMGARNAPHAVAIAINLGLLPRPTRETTRETARRPR